jgi:O-antigen/teichoic acid export membrane protein
VITAILARGLGREQFGSIGMMLGVYYFVGGFHRANVVLPFIVAAPEDERSGRSLDTWWRINLLWIAIITLALVIATSLASAVIPNQGWIVRALEYASITTPALLLADFGRRWLYQRQMSATVAMASLVYAVVGAGVALVSFKVRSGWMGVAAWSVAGLAAFAAARIALPPGPATWRSAAESWFEHRRFGRWLSACHIPYAFYNSSVVVLIGLFGGPAAAAAYTATRTLTNPALSVVAAVDSLDKPRAARALVTNGLGGLNDSIRRTRRLLASVTGVYLGLMVLIPDLMLSLVFGHAYAGRGMEVRVLAGAFFLMCLNQPSETLLVVLRRGVLMFSIRTLTAVVAVIGLWWGGRLGGVLGSALALLGIQTFNLIALRVGEYLAQRQQRVAVTPGLVSPTALPPQAFVESPIALEEG